MSFSNINENPDLFNSKKQYFTDESGMILMPVNILGMVRSPGTYYLNQNVDIFTILASAGGTSIGANLKKILIYRNNNELIEINLNDILKKGRKLNFIFQPNDTIFIQKSFGHSIISGSPFINIILSFFNILLIYNNL